VSRLEALEARIEKLEKELQIVKPAPEPTHDFLRGNHDWRSDPDLYTPGLRWRRLL
jgi:hypothetical protein